MYFDLEDYRPDISPVGSAISWREGMLMSIIVHLLVVIVVLTNPELFVTPEAANRVATAAQLQAARDRERQQFVFVQPRLDRPAPRPPERGELSDLDRQARAPQRALKPTNPLPFSRGNSPNRVEIDESRASRGREAAVSEQQRGEERGAEAGGRPEQVPAIPGNGELVVPPRSREAPGADRTTPQVAGSLGEALKNLQRYVPPERFDNQAGGGGSPDPTIQFDTKGVEFGPWIRRFVAQVRRNWFIPYAAMAMKGHVVLTFYVHRDGTITQVQVLRPSEVDAFNNSSVNAIVTSNPTQPLPVEYPSNEVFFTVTFYYNEHPPIR